MSLTHSISKEKYLKHKQYFDHSLIILLERQNAKITTLEKEIAIRSATNQKYRATIKTLKWKYKDLQAVNYQLKSHLKENNKDIKKSIKEFEEEMNKLHHQIEDELQKSYTDNNELYDENQRLKKEIERLQRENGKFMKQSNRNSSNSSLPPSTDLFKKPVNMRKPTMKSRGGQPRHPIHRSTFTDTPDTIITMSVKAAPNGAAPVLDTKENILYYRTQEIDAKFVTTITETRYFIKEDGKTVAKEIMNTYKINPVSYSTSFKSKVLYLNSKGTIALQRLCIMLNELSENKIHVCPSTLSKWSKEFYERSQPTRDKLLKEAMRAQVLQVDETGWKINGKQAWIHVLCTNDIAYFTCTQTRADTKTGPLKLLEGYKGTIIHDHFKAYYRLEESEHGECNAHILRYLKSGIEFDESIECAKLLELMKQMNRRKKELLVEGIGEIQIEEYQKYEKEYLEIIEKALRRYQEKYPNIASKYIPEYIKTMKRMKVYKEEHLRFLKDFKVPFDNNKAELQMRPTKTKKKVSGQSLNIETANHFCAIHTINQTSILQNANTLKTIEDILSGRIPSIVSFK